MLTYELVFIGKVKSWNYFLGGILLTQLARYNLPPNNYTIRQGNGNIEDLSSFMIACYWPRSVYETLSGTVESQQRFFLSALNWYYIQIPPYCDLCCQNTFVVSSLCSTSIVLIVYITSEVIWRSRSLLIWSHENKRKVSKPAEQKTNVTSLVGKTWVVDWLNRPSFLMLRLRE